MLSIARFFYIVQLSYGLIFSYSLLAIKNKLYVAVGLFYLLPNSTYSLGVPLLFVISRVVCMSVFVCVCTCVCAL